MRRVINTQAVKYKLRDEEPWLRGAKITSGLSQTSIAENSVLILPRRPSSSNFIFQMWSVVVQLRDDVLTWSSAMIQQL